jgi:YbbR domain-containing protein
MPIEVVYGTVPDSVNIGPQEIDPQTVTVRGPSSRVNSVAKVVARVAIDASALNVDRDVDLVAVDPNGNQVPSVDLDPPRAHVTIPVAQEIATRTVPVVPQLTGTPATGYRVTSVAVEPLIVTVNGEASVVSQIQSASTEPIDITGRTSDLEAEVGLALPNGVSVSDSTVRVMLTVAQETGSQTYGVGVALSGEQPGFSYTVSPDHANVTLGGAVATLASIDPAVLVATADVSTLAPGTTTVTLSFQQPDGLDLISIDPAEVTVTITAPPTPVPTPIPTATLVPQTAPPTAAASP